MSEIQGILERDLGKLFRYFPHGNYLKIRTPFLLPDGDILDLLLEETSDGWIVTDAADTLGWLWTVSIKDKRTPKQNQMIADICRTVGIELDRGELRIRVSDSSQLADAVCLLGQSAIRVADAFYLTKRLEKPNINDRIDRYFRKRKVEFTRYEPLRGESGKERLVEFRVHSPERQSLVKVLSPTQPSIAHGIAEIVSEAWKDLKHLRTGSESLHFVSLLDDTRTEWDGADIRLLEEDSEIAFWSKPEAFLHLLMGERAGYFHDRR